MDWKALSFIEEFEDLKFISIALKKKLQNEKQEITIFRILQFNGSEG